MENIDIMEYAKIAFTVVLAVAGWVVAHHFTSRRDLKNSRRSTRIEALSHCYKTLVRSGIDGVMVTRDDCGILVNKATAVEDAIALIHLYGNAQQSALASAYVRQIAKNQNGDSTKLVNNLRTDIRRMIALPDIESAPEYLRVTLKNSEPTK